MFSVRPCRQLLDRRKQQELERIFEDNFLPAAATGSTGPRLQRPTGGAAAPTEDQPRQVPAFLKAHSRQPPAAATAGPGAAGTLAAATGSQAVAAAAAAGWTGGGHNVTAATGVAAPPPSAPGGASSSSVVMPALPVPYWSRGRNARLGSKELLVQVRQALPDALTIYRSLLYIPAETGAGVADSPGWQDAP